MALPVGTRDPRVVAGALHVHTTRSDGGGTPAAIAAAASMAGLNFIVLTDHGDGTRTPDPPAWREGVLVLDGVEISTAGGHYIAMGMTPSAYPLAGEARDVAEDVARLGGLGIIAHPASPKPELAWTDWAAPFDGAEWLSADAEWRDERWTTLGRAAVTYLFRPGPSVARVFDRPAALLARLDERARDRPVLLVAGTDAHGGIGGEGARRLPVPSYESAFRTLSVRVTLRGALRGDPERDAALVLDALRARRAYTSIDALAGPARLTFTAQAGRARVEMGGRLPSGTPVTLRVRANGPPSSMIMLLRDGQPVASGPVPSLDYVSDGALGVYRVEVQIPGAPGDPPVPWILSNAIAVGPEPEPPAADEPRVNPRVVLFELGDRSRWMAERDPTSHAEISTARGEGPLELSYTLGLNESASPFAAVVRELPAGLAACEALAFSLSGSRDMRVSVQVREPGGDRPSEGRRWRRSVFVPAGGRTMVVRFAELAPVAGAGRARPDAAAVRSLLLVVDTLNARAGDRGVLRVHRAGCL
ncbi:MAG: CehA/McbA family metallohydrolase [Vicinamibacterales bacterium]